VLQPRKSKFFLWQSTLMRRQAFDGLRD